MCYLWLMYSAFFADVRRMTAARKALVRFVFSPYLTVVPTLLCHISCPLSFGNSGSFTAYCSKLSGFSMKSKILIISTPLSL